MSVRRSLRKRPGTPRRSLRLEGQKNLPFHDQRPTTSSVMGGATPRTLLKNVLQTQAIVTPLVSGKPSSSKPVEPDFQLPLGRNSNSNLEISMPDSVPKEKSHISRLRLRLKRVRLSEFERGVNNQLDSNTAQSSLENISLTKSLQVSFRTPAPLQTDGKKGLIRRPQNYKGINVKDFEGDIEQNLLHTKESQSYLVDSQSVSDAEMHTAATELFAQPQLSGQNAEEVSVAQSQHVSMQQSLTGEAVLPSDQTPRESNREAEQMESTQKETLSLEVESMDGTEVVLKKKADNSTEEQQDSLQDVSGELLYSIQKEMLTQGSDDAGRMESDLQERPVTPENVQEILTGSNCMAQLLSPEKHLDTTSMSANLEMDLVRSSTPVHADVQEAQPGHLFILHHEKPAKHSIKEMVAHLIEEMDKSVVPTVVGQSLSEVSMEEEFSPSGEAAQISPHIRVETPSTYVSKRNTKELERLPAKERIDGVTQQNGKECVPQDMLDMETDHNVIPEDEMDPDSEENSHAETDSENIDPTGKTPAFVRARAFNCTTLLATPHTSKVAASRSPPKQHSVRRAPKPCQRAHRAKSEPTISSSLIKKLFSHYVGMPVAKDAFKAVERCVNLYFKHLSDDLEVYANHARRKTTEPADMELLMKRQGLITDKTPLNVLIERHLPLEYRKLLIPIAASGNKVVPSKRP